jgi:hypothetical protein
MQHLDPTEFTEAQALQYYRKPEDASPDTRLLQVKQENENYRRWFWCNPENSPYKRYFRFADGEPSRKKSPSQPGGHNRTSTTSNKKTNSAPLEQKTVEVYDVPNPNDKSHSLGPAFTSRNMKSIENVISFVKASSAASHKQHCLVMQALTTLSLENDTQASIITSEIVKLQESIFILNQNMKLILENLSAPPPEPRPLTLRFSDRSNSVPPQPKKEQPWIDTKNNGDKKKRKNKTTNSKKVVPVVQIVSESKKRKVVPASPPFSEDEDIIDALEMDLTDAAKDDKGDIISDDGEK